MGSFSNRRDEFKRGRVVNRDGSVKNADLAQQVDRPPQARVGRLAPGIIVNQ